MTGGPSHGALGGTAPNLTYTPAADYNGQDLFTFVVNDGRIDSAPATVTVSITSVPDAPTPITGLTAIPGEGSVRLAWSTSIDPDGDLAAYVIYRRNGTEAYATLATTTGPAYEDIRLTNGTTYDYQVQALDATGLESAAAEASETPSTTAYDAYASQNPSLTFGQITGNVSGTKQAGDGLVQSLDETLNGGAGMARLTAEYRLHTTAEPDRVTLLELHLTANWTNKDPADPLRVYLFDRAAWQEITADLLADGLFQATVNPERYVNASGEIRVQFTDTAAIKKENRDTLIIDQLYAHVSTQPAIDMPPAVPTGLTATAGDGQVSLAWLPSPELDVTGYRVYRGMAPGVYGDPIGVNQTSYTDTTIANGTIYYYVVTAIDAAGHESVVSQEVNARPGPASIETSHVKSITLHLQQTGKTTKAVATITVVNQSQLALAGVIVKGDWFFNGSLVQAGAMATTGTTGNATITSPGQRPRSGDIYTFRVTDLVLSGSVYDPGQNIMGEGSIAVP